MYGMCFLELVSRQGRGLESQIFLALVCVARLIQSALLYV